MHALWVIPDYYTFLREELAALAPRVDRLSAISQAAAPADLDGVRCITIPADRRTPARIARRLGDLVLAAAHAGAPMRPAEWPTLRRIARQNEAIRKFVLAEGVDIIHVHFAMPEGTCGWQAASGRPIVATFRGVDILSLPQIGYGFINDPFYAANLRCGLAHASAITVASRQTLEAAKSAGADEGKIHLIRNGVDLTRFSQVSPERIRSARQAVGAGARQMILGAGNLVPGKAFDRLIHAFDRLRRKDCVLIIAGDGAEMRNLKTIVDTAQLSDSVVFTGRVDREQMADLFHACDLFVHPSLSEGFGNVVVEAMAAGKPVIATRTGVAADVLENGINGLLVSPGDVDELAAAMTHVLSHPEQTRVMAAAGMELAHREMSLNMRAEAFVRLYRDLTSKSCATAAGTTVS